MGSIGPWQVIIILLVVVLLFGAKKLPQIGKGMGEALRNFKKSVNDIDDATDITPIASIKFILENILSLKSLPLSIYLIH